MLRISVDKVEGETTMLRLDGQVTGRWVKLLQGMCDAESKEGSQLTIDMRNVSFADRDGIALLRNLRDRRIEILNALPFIAEQIKREG